MTDLNDVRENARSQLQNLRDSITGFQKSPKYLSMFDEFVRECELGLALETLCDYLLETTAPVDEGVLGQIESLHALMNVKDGCVDSLKKKMRSN
jgi:hypothetical protein